MIGKLFRGGFLETKRTERETKEEENKCQTIMTISDNLLRRQLGQLGTTFSGERGGQLRPAGRKGEACEGCGMPQLPDAAACRKVPSVVGCNPYGGSEV